ncbi:MAG: class I tRNA ligase family protein [Cyclobacteriaceae bacterium]|nr:class I tRNA ligase family protein [Cyclobacteriaceae bacterium]
MRDAIDVAIQELEKRGIGKRQVNYKMRDAGWSRQRYWGEPFPVVFKDDMPYAMKESDLPLELPPSDNFKPSGNGEGPLANLTDWINFKPNEKRDSNTMPTHAGAAWYFLRYVDPHNKTAFADPKALDYWNQVDVYIGGAEHAVAHLLYARLWTKVLHDLGYLKFDEPFKKLINQGKITGDSRFVHRINGTNLFVTESFKSAIEELEKSTSEYSDLMTAVNSQIGYNKFNSVGRYPITAGVGTHEHRFPSGQISISSIHVDINIVNGLELDTEAFKKWKPDFSNAEFILEDADGNPTIDPSKGKYICGSAIEKMSKSYFNVVNPDQIIDNYGADTLRMYEMFLGPLEASKPWSTQGIDGVFKFLRKVWNLIHDQSGNLKVSEAEPTREELKVLHKTIKKVEQDIENFSFNTSVSEFMICVNELGSLKCNKRAIVEPLVIALSPFAPHIAEELWEKLGHSESILTATYPKYDNQYLVESTFSYPISINGKVRAQMEFALDMPKEDIEKMVLASEIVQKWTEGKPPKKMIVVQGRIVNVVL